MEFLKYKCGCEIPVLDKTIKQDLLPSLYIPYEEITLRLNYGKYCKDSFSLIADGKNKGIFQLESYLGNKWGSELQPSNIEELASLVSIIRPSCLNALSDGKSLTQKFCDRKRGIEQTESIHPSLDDVLGETYNILCYQEQAIKIAMKVAGYSEEQADILRKAIGTKNAALMSSLESSFVEGCKTKELVDNELAHQLFEWIRESQQYSFNKSHAVCYGTISYLCTFVKYHFPLHFYAMWLAGARERLHKEQEIKELVAEAKSDGLSIKTPNLLTLLWNDCDVCVDEGYIRMGLQCMRKVGNAEISKLKEKLSVMENQLNKKLVDWSWTDILYHLLPNVNSQTAYALITGGVLTGKSRVDMLSEFDKISMLSKRQLEYLREWNLPLKDGLTKLIDKVAKPQKEKIKGIISFLSSQNDDPRFIIKEERNLYGVPLTINPVDVSTTVATNTTCQEFIDGKTLKFGTNMYLSGEISSSRAWKVKNGNLKGQTMASFQLSDKTNNIACVVFPDVYAEVYDQIYDTNLVIVGGYRSKGNSLCVKEIQMLI